MGALADYLAEIARVRATGAGTAETSYYSALQGAFNSIGAGLKPKVFCVSQLANRRGAGHPDFGLFSQEQLPRGGAGEWTEALAIPERGVVEAKGIEADLQDIVGSVQVRNYLASYGLVLVTNFRDFILVGRNLQNALEVRERFSFGTEAHGFFELAASGRRPAGLATRFQEFFERVLLHQAPLREPRDIAFFLASYARDALARIEERAELPQLLELRTALEQSLGMTFDQQEGEHLFRSTLVQTLFYGLFSAWVTHAREGRGQFDWRQAEWNLHVPMVRVLYEQIATPTKLRPLGLVEVLDWAAAALGRVEREAFFARFEEAHAVQYFYEPFLEAFDPVLRKQLGVWYTPSEIVRYMVERIDRVLRADLGLPNGLADPNVWILDPCCGTGSFLVEVLRRIEQTLRDNGTDALLGQDLKRAATTRVIGFEIMPAPFVISHWQIASVLRRAGAPFEHGTDERAAVYLTNALTGWEPADPNRPQLPIPELEQERGAADAVKRDRPILVVLGNPPYNAFAGTSPSQEQGLVKHYKRDLIRRWGIKKFNLDELYVRFFRVAERRIAERTGRGVISFVTNYSWLTGTSFVVMRESLLNNFDRFWIENMHGDRKISEYGPDGHTSETIFAVSGFSVGIRQGVAISLMCRTGQPNERKVVRFRDDINASKADDRRTQLLETLNDANFDACYELANPSVANRYRFRPSDVSEGYRAWPKISQLGRIAPLNGLLEKRRGALIDYDRARLERRMRIYLDPNVDWDEVAMAVPGLAANAGRFNARDARRRILAEEPYQALALKPYFVRPFDKAWAYVTAVRPVWNEPRPALLHVLPDAGGFVVSRVAGVANPEGFPLCYTPLLGDDHAMRADAYYAPIIENLSGAPRANLSDPIRAYLVGLGVPNVDGDVEIAALLWRHVLAIGYSTLWLSENADGIRQDWPRVPIPSTLELLRASAALGQQVATLLDPDADVVGVTTGNIRPEFRVIAVLAKQGDGAIQGEDLSISAGWGHRGREGVVAPGRGRVIPRNYRQEEAAVAARAGVFGANTSDVYLNTDVYWRNVPEAVWDFTIGGYQVLKKWLSYRERDLLGRQLTPEEARHVTYTSRRLAALRLLSTELDANYEACKNNAFVFPEIAAQAALESPNSAN